MARAGRRRPAAACSRTGTLGAGVLLVAALLVIVNYFGWKYYKRFDWTAEPALLALGEEQERPRRSSTRTSRSWSSCRPAGRALRAGARAPSRYEAASPRIQVRVVDPEKNPVEAQQLVQKYEVTSASVVVVERRATSG